MANGTRKMTAYTPLEEFFNSLTHGLGTVLAIAGLAVLVVLAAVYGDAWKVVSSSIYGATMVMLYFASTMYHSISSERAKHWLKVFDHVAIYMLIAGTYTPYMLVNIRGAWGWSIFGVIWGLAILGAVFKLFFTGRFKAVSLSIYILMGWLVIIAIKPMVAAVPPAGMWMLLIGGLLYTGGVVFYAWEKMYMNHAVWHLFVLAGSVVHYFSVLFYVILT